MSNRPSFGVLGGGPEAEEGGCGVSVPAEHVARKSTDVATNAGILLRYVLIRFLHNNISAPVTAHALPSSTSWLSDRWCVACAEASR
jgi:hypothetical protein